MQDREYPRIYCEFETNSKAGPPRKYWIQDATEDQFDEIVENFVTGFLKDEPISKYMNGLSDEISIQEIRVMHKHILDEKLSLACLTKNEKGETKLVGFNVIFSATPNDKSENPKGWFLKFIINLFSYLNEQRNVFQEFGVDKCLEAMGLYVLPDYRGEGLGEKLLKTRTLLGISLGYKVTSTLFSSIISQKQAYKAGFQDFYCIDYEELGKTCPQFCIPNIQEHTKAIKILYKFIE